MNVDHRRERWIGNAGRQYVTLCSDHLHMGLDQTILEQRLDQFLHALTQILEDVKQYYIDSVLEHIRVSQYHMAIFQLSAGTLSLF